MPLIQTEKRVANEQLTVTLSSETLQELRSYAKFLNNSSVAYVVTQLITTLSRDKEFQQWKASQAGLASALLTARSEKENSNGKSA